MQGFHFQVIDQVRAYGIWAFTVRGFDKPAAFLDPAQELFNNLTLEFHAEFSQFPHDKILFCPVRATDPV